MSRMLEALRQIEARSAEPPASDDFVPPEEPPSNDSPPPDETQQEDRQVEPEEPVGAEEPVTAEEPVVEAALSQVDAAAAMVADSLAHETFLGVEDEHTRAYTKLADNILSQLPSDRPATLMFTSPGDGTGKTGLLVPLATALLERTTGELLVIDGNLHKPGLASRLGVEADRGLADVLLGAANWQQVVRPTVVERLNILPGVEFPATGGRPPQRLNLEPLLEELADHYKLVLIDTASLAYPEVAQMSRYCDGTYLVVRIGHTRRRTVAEAARVLQRCGGRLLGCVVLGKPGSY